MSSGGKGKEKEIKVRKKPGRVPTACAECRRLKFKCDKNVPCAKCVSRGCGSICPDGVLTQGRGGRLVLANTEELHGKIDDLTSRNRELEKALRALQANITSEPHPLLQSDTIRVPLQPDSSPSQSASSSSKSPTASSAPAPPEPMDVEEEEHVKLDAFGTLTVREGREMSYFGRTAQPEFLIPTGDPWSQPSSRIISRISQLGSPNAQLPMELMHEILNYLPQLSLASHLCKVYLDHGTLFCTPISRNQLLDEILPQVYQTKSSSEFSAYDSLSLLLIIFALAILLDHDNRSSLSAHDYYQLSRAAHQFIQSSYNTTLESIQTLAHMTHYLELCDNNMDHIYSRWKHVGDAVRLVHSAGLHAPKWKLPVPEAQRRNQVFWSVFVVDTWTNFALGRPSVISKQSYDCQPPLAITELVALNGSSNNDYATWRIHFSILLNEIMHTALGPKQPSYPAILDFDCKIRDFHVPEAWRVPEEGDSTPPPANILFFRFLVILSKEIVLLTLHRAYFVQALQESGIDLSRHRYLPSVVAVYRSAWRLIRALARAWGAIPRLIAKLRSVWSSAVSASVALALLVTRSPSSHLSISAVEELENVASLFDRASSTSQAAASLQPYIQRTRRKARDALSNSPGRLLGSAHGHQRPEPTENVFSTADLEILSGKTRFCGQNTTSAHSTSGEMGPPSRATSVTISENADSTSHPSRSQHWQAETLHPTLLRDLREFGIRSSIPPTSSFPFYDYPSDLNRTRTPLGSHPGSATSLSSTHGERRPSPAHLHPSSAAAGGSSSQLHPQPGPSQSRDNVRERDMYEPHLSRELSSERHASSSASPQPPPSPEPPRSYQSQHQSYSSHQQQEHHQHSSTTYPSPFATSTVSTSATSHIASIPAGNSVMFSYFHPASFPYEPYVDYRRTGYGSLSTTPPGMMPPTSSGLTGFAGGGYAAAGFTSAPIVLDSSWSNFVEQLGF
ncbi:fungal-specific transcription factor domain-containing protein [Panaeolus papilionaceus]|nr:fungal-specific transcription factor domain-containing protein [Panaeolus papilionaceus]